MADKIITIAQVSNGVYAPDTSIASPRIVQVEDTNIVITYAHIGSGRYANQANIPDGTYKFYDGLTEKPNVLGANGEWIGDSSLPYVPMSGASGVTGPILYNSELDFTNADAKTLAYKKYVDLADAVQHAYTDEKYADAIEYIDTQISNIPALSLAQSGRIIRFWQGAATITNKVYGALLNAVNSLNLHPGQYAVILIEGLTSDIYRAPAGVLAKSTTISNITFRSVCKEWGISFADGVVNKLVNLEGIKVFFGAGANGGYGGATRQYTGFKFSDCAVFCYNNLALYNGEYRNTNFYMAPGKTLTFYGSAILDNVKCNSAISFDGGFNGHKDFSGSLGAAFIPGAAMPADPTIPES